MPTLTIRPRRSQLVTVIVSFVLGSIPLFTVLYLYSVPLGTWPAILVIQLAITAFTAASAIRMTMIHTRLTPTTLEGRSMTAGLEKAPREDIAEVHFVPVHHGTSFEPIVQFVALDRTGRCLYRMRGQFWYEADLHRMATALGVPVTILTVPQSETEFYTRYPGSRYWFEQSRTFRIGVIALLVGITIVGTAGLMTLIGVPIFG